MAGRSFVLALVVAVCGAGLVCAPARAGIVTKSEHAAVDQPGITAPEREAISITSVTASSDHPWA